MRPPTVVKPARPRHRLRCQQDDNSILFVFGDTSLRDAHVAARGLRACSSTPCCASPRAAQCQPLGDARNAQAGDTGAALLDRVAPRTGLPRLIRALI